MTAGRIRFIAPTTLNYLLEQGSALALLDVREHGEYNTAHIRGSSSVPRRQLEERVVQLVPFYGVQVVVCDDDERRAVLAAGTLERMGYTRVAMLEGGLNRWFGEGCEVEWGINVPSKDFGEMIEVRERVPTIEADELGRRLKGGEKFIILDARTPEEYSRFSIPGARSVPGGELVLRITDIAKADPDATVVVNCGGRTRSIIGARILQRMGWPNVLSLKNGTSGWVLAGLSLEVGARADEPPAPSAEGLARAEMFAAKIAAEDAVVYLSIEEVQGFKARASEECVYLIDVRTEQEYAAGHIPGFWWCPGGQAVQRSDEVVAIRHAPIVFCCDGTSRATVTASWYRQMGFAHVYVVEGGVAAWGKRGLPVETGSEVRPPFAFREAVARVEQVSPDELASWLSCADAPTIIFVGTSREFAEGHVAGSRWLSRSWLELRIELLAPEKSAPLVVTDRNGRDAILSAATLHDLGYRRASALSGGTKAWREAGLPLERGLAGVTTPPDDVLPVWPDRSYADMINYLHWEQALGEKYESGPSRWSARGRENAGRGLV